MNAIEQSPRPSVVVLVDVVGSSRLADFASLRDRHIARLSKAHRRRGWIAADYTVTAWDEFQTVLGDARRLPDVLLDLRRTLAPWELYVGVGIGLVSGWRSRKPINLALSGEGFERAREAIEALKAGKGDKYRRLTRVRSGDEATDALLNLIYGLHDTLLQQVTARQWQTATAAAAANVTQEDVAGLLDVQPSTVTRNLKRGHYWQMQETIRVVSTVMEQIALKRAIS